LTAKTEALSQASIPLMQKAYAEQAQAAGGADCRSGSASRYAADDGVVDAEFEEVKDDKK
jgi:molecular chaperone DnaK